MLTHEDIATLAGSPTVYNKGCRYYQQDRVGHLEEVDSGQYEAEVMGTERYQVSVSLSYDEHVSAYTCTCPAHRSYPGACKHVVATLKAIQAVQEERAKMSRKGGGITSEPQSIREYEEMKRAKRIDPAMQTLLKYFEEQVQADFPVERDGQMTRLVPQLVLSHGYYDRELVLQLSIGGPHKQYVVKDLPRLVMAKLEKGVLPFGKDYIFDGGAVRLEPQSQKLMDWITGILMEEEALAAIDRSALPSFRSRRQMTMTRQKLDRLSEILDGQAIKLKFPQDGKTVDVVFSEGHPPLAAELKVQNNLLCLGLYPVERSPLQQLLPGSIRYVYHGGRIYRLSLEEEARLMPFIDCLNSSQHKPVCMPISESGRIMGDLIPALRRIAAVEIEPSLEDKYEREPLVAHVYLDRYHAVSQRETGLSARIEFHYGDRHFCGVTGNKLNQQARSEKILIRQHQDERRLLGIFEDYSFSAYRDLMVVTDEEAIFDFCAYALERIQKLAEVYGTEDFDGIKVRKSMKITAGIRLTESGMLEMKFQQQDFSSEELMEILTAYRQKKRYHRLKNGSFMALDTEDLAVAASLLDGLGLKTEDLDGRTLELPRYRAMYADALLKEHRSIISHRSTGFKKMVQEIIEPVDLEYSVPEGIQGKLRDYQVTGFRWLKSLAAYGMGGILADDMGLGKTLQVIAFLLSEKSTSTLKSLVVAPTSLIYNWQDEIRRFAPGLKAEVIAGSPEERHAQLVASDGADVLITSYGMLKRDLTYYKEQQFQYCIIDEAQHIKNPRTLNAKSVKDLKARGTFALTGTPIENSLTELWSIFDFLMPGYLYSHNRFVTHFEKPIVLDHDSRALNDLSRHIRPFLLRRMKQEVLTELPDKIETRLTCAMTGEQERLYKAHLAKAQKEMAKLLPKGGESVQQGRIEILALLTRLRQLCCHPGMFLDQYHHGSGKLEALEELLEDAVGGGHRVLVFSQFTTMLKIIQESLINKGMDCFYLDGSTPAEKRMQMVRAFNQNEDEEAPAIFLISLKAGGTGLNLTGADVVVHYDPWWNPAVEDQATDRAYRMGQDKKVQVYRLVTRNTLEEKIYDLQQKKRELVDSVIQPGESFLHKMSEDEIRSLFT